MKNEFVTGRVSPNYLLKMVISFISVSAKKMKIQTGRYRKAEKKPPVLAGAVSEGILDFFKEMGYSPNHKKRK